VVRRGLLLNYATIGYNLLEAVAAIVAGVLAGSVALLGFGLDSVVEVTSSVAAQWRLRRDDEATRHRSEEISLRVIGISFSRLRQLRKAGIGSSSPLTDPHLSLHCDPDQLSLKMLMSLIVDSGPERRGKYDPATFSGGISQSDQDAQY